MTTILTEEDFIRAMDSNPAFLEAARSRLLTREILELPATVQRLSDTLERFIESTNRRMDAWSPIRPRLSDGRASWSPTRPR